MASSCNDLGTLLNKRGKLDEVERLLRRASAIREEILDAEHPDGASSCTNLGNLLK